MGIVLSLSPSPSVRAAGSIVVLQNGGFIMENPMKMDDLGALQMVFHTKTINNPHEL